MHRVFVFAALTALLGSAVLAEDASTDNAPVGERRRLLSYPGGPLEGLRDAGIDMKGSLSLTYQGLVAGEGAKNWRAGGKADLWIALDGERLGLWDGVSASVHYEAAFGQSANNTGAGFLVPPNTMLAFPSLGGSDTELSVVLSQSIGDRGNLSLGKFNLLDIAAKTPISGGGGLETFMNVAVAAPISGVTPPYLFGAIGSYQTEPLIYTVMIYDPRNAQSSDVISDPFSEGVTYSLSATLPTKVAGRTTYIGVRGA